MRSRYARTFASSSASRAPLAPPSQCVNIPAELKPIASPVAAASGAGVTGKLSPAQLAALLAEREALMQG